LPLEAGEAMAWKYSRWLTLSSLFFLVPAGVAWQAGSRNLSSLYVVTSLVSANYWRRCTRGFRRNADLVVAKISFAITFFMTYDNPTLWAFAAAAGALYGAALYWHSVESQWWLPAHGAMHVVVATGMVVAANTVAAR
jgi:hypothetical protein